MRCFAMRFSRIGFQEGPAFNMFLFSLHIGQSMADLRSSGFLVHLISHVLFPCSLLGKGFSWIPTTVFPVASGWEGMCCRISLEVMDEERDEECSRTESCQP